MLQVCVHHDDGLAACRGEPRHQRTLMTEVARQANAADAHVCSAERADGVPRPVRAAIVDEDDLEIVLGRVTQYLAQIRVQDVEIAFLVVRWYHDGNHALTPEQSGSLRPAMFVPRGA